MPGPVRVDWQRFMANKLKVGSMLPGLIFTIVSALAVMAISDTFFFTVPRLEPYLFDAGVDSLGAFVCAALFFGCMEQDENGAFAFKALIIQVSAAFMLNLLMYFIEGVPEYRTAGFVLVLVSKLVDLVMICFFYQYVRRTLGFEGKLADIADKGIPILLVLQSLVLLSNAIYPFTFAIDAGGSYKAMELSWAEDIFLITASIVTAILIVRSESPRNQKAAALTFIFMPLIMYVFLGATFGNASQYGMVLMSLIIMYCVIFNYNSSKLASTQTELNMARDIQASMLPSIFPAFPNRKEFDLFASMDPAKEVGGDFYDFFMVDDDHLGMVIADVSGKGVPAALFMMISKTIIQNYAMLGISPAEVLAKTNVSLCAQNKMDMFTTAWIGILELSTGKMVCSNAGHEFPVICRGGRYELFRDSHGLALGCMEFSRYKNYEIGLEAGDKIFVYTDGVPEATNAGGELFSMGRMVDALNSDAGAGPRETLGSIRAAVDGFVGTAEQFDDLTMLCLEYRGVQDRETAEGRDEVPEAVPSR